MLRVDLKELQANLDYYFKKLEEGEHIEVLEHGKVIYKLTEPFVHESEPLPETLQSKPRKGERIFHGPLGLLDPDAFSMSTPDEIVELFYNSALPDSKRK